MVRAYLPFQVLPLIDFKAEFVLSTPSSFVIWEPFLG